MPLSNPNPYDASKISLNPFKPDCNIMNEVSSPIERVTRMSRPLSNSERCL